MALIKILLWALNLLISYLALSSISLITIFLKLKKIINIYIYLKNIKATRLEKILLIYLALVFNLFYSYVIKQNILNISLIKFA